MNGRRLALVAGLTLSLVMIGASIGFLISGNSSEVETGPGSGILDPLLQEETHDHRNASQHVFSTPNIRPLGYDPLTAPGNAEVQVAESPDGRVYAYIAGWTEMHIVDVTDHPTHLLLACVRPKYPGS